MRLPRSHALPIVALALVVASCGGGDSTTDSSPESTAAATSASTASEPVTSDTTGGDAAGSTMSATDAAAVDEAATEFLASPYVNGATALYVAVSDPQKGDYVQAYGDASVDGPAATVDDSFRIGSITKTFTAVVVLKMVEDGQISLDDTVEDLLADLAVDHSLRASRREWARPARRGTRRRTTSCCS